MKDPIERAQPLIELLYAAPGDPPAWQRFLVALRDAISPHCVVIFLAQRRGRVPGTLAGSGLDLLHAPLDELLRPTVPHDEFMDLPLGAVNSFEADNALARSKVFQEVLAPQGVLSGPVLSLILERTERLVLSAVMVLPRSSGWKPLPRDRALLEVLGPHMITARKLETRLEDRRRYTHALVSAFDRLALGVIFLDENGRVAYANQSASETLGLTPGFADPAVLAAAGPDDRTRTWRSVLRTVRSEGEEAFVYSHPEDGRPLQFLATPFYSAPDDPTGEAHFTRAVFIGDPKARTGDPTRVLRDLFGLTKGEARLALLLVSGCSIGEAAHILEVKESTVRSVLRAIFAKTGTNRQADLVRLLLEGPVGNLRERPSAARRTRR